MNYRWTVAARSDLIDAADFYDSQRHGLGAEFGVDVGLALSRILDSPDTWPEFEPGYRRYRLDRFPYALVYRILNKRMIEIVAMADLRAQPGSWRRNLGQ